MLKLIPDVFYSRRQRIHFVTDERDQVIFSGPTVESCIAKLDELGEHQARCVGQDQDWILTFVKPS